MQTLVAPRRIPQKVRLPHFPNQHTKHVSRPVIAKKHISRLLRQSTLRTSPSPQHASAAPGTDNTATAYSILHAPPEIYFNASKKRFFTERTQGS